MTRRRILISTVAVLLIAGSAAAQSWPPANPPYLTGFPVQLAGTEEVRLGSVNLGDVNGDGQLDIVVGTLDGVVHAYESDGTELWTYDTGSMAIESKPAIGDIDGDGSAEVVVTAGSTQTPSAHGGMYVISHLGSLQCEYQSTNTGGDGFRDGLFSSPALADLDGNDGGKLEIAFGGWDDIVRAVHHNCVVYWEKDVDEVVWSSPAIADLDGDGQLDVVIGGTADTASGAASDGGYLYVLDGDTGNDHAGFPLLVDEVIWSSPSVGDITGDGELDIVVGTGYCWADSACVGAANVNPGVGRYLNGWSRTGQALSGWPVSLPGTYAFGSPALADMNNNGVLDVVVNTIDPGNPQGGLVYALTGSGQNLPGWPAQVTTPTNVHASTKASPVVADLNGSGCPEVILPSTWELVVIDCNGNQLSREVAPPVPPADLQLRTRYILTGGAAVGDIDGDGDLEVVVGGANQGGSPGALFAWDFSQTLAGSAWTQFRRDTRNTGADLGLVFEDGFESGNITKWSWSAP